MGAVGPGQKLYDVAVGMPLPCWSDVGEMDRRIDVVRLAGLDQDATTVQCSVPPTDPANSALLRLSLIPRIDRSTVMLARKLRLGGVGQRRALPLPHKAAGPPRCGRGSPSRSRRMRQFASAPRLRSAELRVGRRCADVHSTECDLDLPTFGKPRVSPVVGSPPTP